MSAATASAGVKHSHEASAVTANKFDTFVVIKAPPFTRYVSSVLRGRRIAIAAIPTPSSTNVIGSGTASVGTRVIGAAWAE
jgi:hypothetical protein